MDIAESARKVLRFLRESRGYSPEDVVARMPDEDRVAPSTLEKWERGPTQLTFENARRILEALEVSPAEYFERIVAHQRAFGARPTYPLPEQARLPLFSELAEQSALYSPVPSTYAAFARIEADKRAIKDSLEDLMQGVYFIEFERLRERAGSRPPSLPTPRPKRRSRKARAED